MLKSDKLYLAQFALDPEMESQFDDMNFLFDDENEETAKDRALDSLFGNQDFDSLFENYDEMEDQVK